MPDVKIKKQEPLMLEDLEEGNFFQRLDGKDEDQVYLKISPGGTHSEMFKKHLAVDQVPCIHLPSAVLYAPRRSTPVKDLGDEMTIED